MLVEGGEGSSILPWENLLAFDKVLELQFLICVLNGKISLGAVLFFYVKERKQAMEKLIPPIFLLFNIIIKQSSLRVIQYNNKKEFWLQLGCICSPAL